MNMTRKGFLASLLAAVAARKLPAPEPVQRGGLPSLTWQEVNAEPVIQRVTFAIPAGTSRDQVRALARELDKFARFHGGAA